MGWIMVSPYRSLPPLTTLRTFEAVARQLSFTRAADELALTQSAVSHQIGALERHLGARLFSRLNPVLSSPPRAACCSKERVPASTVSFSLRTGSAAGSGLGC